MFHSNFDFKTRETDPQWPAIAVLILSGLISGLTLEYFQEISGQNIIKSLNDDSSGIFQGFATSISI